MPIAKEDINSVLEFLKKSYKMGESMKTYILAQTESSSWKERLPVVMKKFEMFFNNGIDVSKLSLSEINKLTKTDIFLSDSLTEENNNKMVEVIELLNSLNNANTQVRSIMFDNLDKFLESKITKEQLLVYVELSKKIEQSPSQEIQRLKQSLIDQLIKSKNPLQKYTEIENIFVKNNVPLVGKIYGVFEALHDEQQLREVTKKCHSPILKEASTRLISYIIYKDLLNIHIKSGNRSLKEYIQIVQKGSNLVDRYEKKGITSLNQKELEEMKFFVDKMETLLARSNLDTSQNAFKDSIE
jgi:hypothetical protein